MSVSVSVILPTYNRAETLRNASESVLSQSFRDLELIIVDDGSADETEAVVSSLNDPRVQFIKRENNGGAAAARNTGLTAARGRFIAFQDSDDIWLPGKLARQIALFETVPKDVGVVCGAKILYGRDAAHNVGPGRVAIAPPPRGRLELDEDQVKRFLAGNRISLQNSLFRRSCFSEVGAFDPCAKANVDWEFTSRLAQRVRVYEDSEPVVLSFLSQDSISSDNRKKILGLLRILKKNRSALARYPDVYARNLLLLSRLLLRIGKRRWAYRFALAAMRQRPSSTMLVLRLHFRRLMQLAFGR